MKIEESFKDLKDLLSLEKRLYSGLFVLLKQKIQLSREGILWLVNGVMEGFWRLVYGLARS